MSPECATHNFQKFFFFFTQLRVVAKNFTTSRFIGQPGLPSASLAGLQGVESNGYAEHDTSGPAVSSSLSSFVGPLQPSAWSWEACGASQIPFPDIPDIPHKHIFNPVTSTLRVDVADRLSTLFMDSPNTSSPYGICPNMPPFYPPLQPLRPADFAPVAPAPCFSPRPLPSLPAPQCLPAVSQPIPVAHPDLLSHAAPPPPRHSNAQPPVVPVACPSAAPQAQSYVEFLSAVKTLSSSLKDVTKLKEGNYATWSAKVLQVLDICELAGSVDGLQTLLEPMDVESVRAWRRCDGMVREAIELTVEDSQYAYLKGQSSDAAAWLVLREVHAPLNNARAM